MQKAIVEKCCDLVEAFDNKLMAIRAAALPEAKMSEIHSQQPKWLFDGSCFDTRIFQPGLKPDSEH